MSYNEPAEHLRAVLYARVSTEEQAEEMIEKADKKRSAYYNYYSYKTWGAAATYHLCVDSSVMGIDKTVEYILQFVKHKLGLA